MTALEPHELEGESREFLRGYHRAMTEAAIFLNQKRQEAEDRHSEARRSFMGGARPVHHRQYGKAQAFSEAGDWVFERGCEAFRSRGYVQELDRKTIPFNTTKRFFKT